MSEISSHPVQRLMPLQPYRNHKDIRPPRFCDICPPDGQQKHDKSVLQSHQGTPVFKTASAFILATLELIRHFRSGLKLLLESDLTTALLFHSGLFALWGHNAPLRRFHNRAQWLPSTGLRTPNKTQSTGNHLCKQLGKHLITAISLQYLFSSAPV